MQHYVLTVRNELKQLFHSLSIIFLFSGFLLFSCSLFHAMKKAWKIDETSEFCLQRKALKESVKLVSKSE